MGETDPSVTNPAAERHQAPDAGSLVRVEMSYAEACDFRSYWGTTHGSKDEPSCSMEVALLPSELDGFRAYQDGANVCDCVPYVPQKKKAGRNLLVFAATAALGTAALAIMHLDPNNIFFSLGALAVFLAFICVVVPRMAKDEVHAESPGGRRWMQGGVFVALLVVAFVFAAILGLKLALDAGDWFIDAADRVLTSQPAHSAADASVGDASGIAFVSAEAMPGRGRS